MACASVQAYSKQCGKGISGGVQKLWIVAYSDLAPISGSTEVYALASGSTMVSNISLASGKTFSSVGILKESVSYKGSAKKDSTTNSFDNTTEITLSISNISTTAQAFVDNLFEQPISLLIKLRSGKYIVCGLNGLTELESAEESTGTKNADFNGYTLKFSGSESGMTLVVDPTLILSIVDKP